MKKNRSIIVLGTTMLSTSTFIPMNEKVLIHNVPEFEEPVRLLDTTLSPKEYGKKLLSKRKKS